MKKELFKHFMMVVLMAVMSIGFVACSDNDEPDSGEVAEQLAGTWQFDHGTTTAMGQTITISRSQLLSTAQQMGVQIWDETLRFSGSKVNGADYVVSGSTFYFKDYPDLKSTYKLSGETLQFTYDMSELVGMQCTVVLYYSKK